MARWFEANKSQYLESVTTPVTSIPLTFAGWFYVNTIGTGGTIFSIADSLGSNYFTLLLDNGTNGTVSAEKGGGTNAHTTTTYTVGRWHHGCALFGQNLIGGGGAVPNVVCYLNGGGRAVNSSATTETGVNKMNIGVLNTGGLFSKMDGALAEVAVWQTILMDSEIKALAAGVPPWMVQQKFLRGYWLPGQVSMDSAYLQRMSGLSPGTSTLNGTFEPDWNPHRSPSNLTYKMTVTGGSKLWNHPPMRYPPPKRFRAFDFITPVTVAPPATNGLLMRRRKFITGVV